MTNSRVRILIIGAYGVFGGRLACLLSDQPQLTIFIAGRSLAKANAFIEGIQGRTKFVATQFDRAKDVEPQVRALSPQIIVDATGPFQNYGDDPYTVVRAALKNTAHYLDLADGTEFVDGIAQFDKDAHQGGVFVLSGVSSFPVLTAAVVRHLSQDLTQIETITAGIAPTPYAGVGENVIRAISSYAGKPVSIRRDGITTSAYGLTETIRYTIRPPGHLPLKSLHYSLVDVPDLTVLPRLWPEVRSIWMGAGPVPASLHHALNAFAWMVRLKLIPSLSPFAKFFHRVINKLRWGDHRGGMFVQIKGVLPGGEERTRSWHLIAEGDDGPLIPSMAAAAIIRKFLNGEHPKPGARAAVTELELTDYEQMFERRTIYTGVREKSSNSAHSPIYQRVLGNAYDQLPPPIQKMHQTSETTIATGRATVDRGSNLISKLVGTLFGFPAAGKDVPLHVTFDCTPEREIWTRTFGKTSFSSMQEEGKEKWQGLIVERFGPFSFGLAAVTNENRLNLIPRRWTFLKIPLPLALAPFGNSYEYVKDGQFCFHVEIQLPIIGRLVQYQGYLEPPIANPSTKTG